MERDAEKRGQVANTCHFCLHVRNWTQGKLRATKTEVCESRGLETPTPTHQYSRVRRETRAAARRCPRTSLLLLPPGNHAPPSIHAR